MNVSRHHAIRIGSFFVLAGLALGAAVMLPPRTAVAPVEIPGAKHTIAVEILANGALYPAEIPVGSTAYDAMRAASASSAFTFSGKDFGGDLGFFVESINGISPESGENRYWTLYINGAVAKVGVSSYIVQNNDILEWKLENIHDESL